MLVLAMDFETSGLDPKVNSVIEVGMVLWDSEIRLPVRMISFFVDQPNLVWDQNLLDQGLSTITPDMLSAYGNNAQKSVAQISNWMGQSDVVLAHNGLHFDRPFYVDWCLRYGIEAHSDKLWVDTMYDLELPPKCHKMLTCMAAFHGFLNPFPHRALFDVMTMLKVVEFYDFNEVVRMARIPLITLRAMVSYDDRDLAKARGFYWKSEEKSWIKEIKECYVQKEIEEATFPIKQLGVKA